MIRKKILSERLVSGLRTKYFPKSRVNQGLVNVVPWVNVVLLLILFVIVDSRLTLQPGITVNLPEAPFRDGSHPGLVVVIRSVEKQSEGGRSERIFFDDQSFAVENTSQMKAFAGKMAASVKKRPGSSMTVMADARVWHGTLIKVFNMAETAGVREVNLAVKEGDPAAVDTGNEGN